MQPSTRTHSTVFTPHWALQHRNTLTVLVHHPADTACIHRHTLFHAACPPHPRTPTPPLAPFTCVQRGWGGTQNNTGIFCCKKGVQIVSMSPSSPNVQEKRAWTPVAPTRISNLLRPRSCMRTPSKPSRVCRYKNAVGIMIDAASDPRLLRCFGNTPAGRNGKENADETDRERLFLSEKLIFICQKERIGVEIPERSTKHLLTTSICISSRTAWEKCLPRPIT